MKTTGQRTPAEGNLRVAEETVARLRSGLAGVGLASPWLRIALRRRNA
ncbi:hypothetical protein [Streptomyces sp. NPDC002690]